MLNSVLDSKFIANFKNYAAHLMDDNKDPTVRQRAMSLHKGKDDQTVAGEPSP